MPFYMRNYNNQLQFYDSDLAKVYAYISCPATNQVLEFGADDGNVDINNGINDLTVNNDLTITNDVVVGNALSTGGDLSVGGEKIAVPTGTSNPSGASVGNLYYNTSTNKLMVYSNLGWQFVSLL